MKISNFRGGVGDISALKTSLELLLQDRVIPTQVFFKIKLNIFLDTLIQNNFF